MAEEDGYYDPYVPKRDLALERRCEHYRLACIELKKTVAGLEEQLQHEKSSRANVKELHAVREENVLLRAELEAEQERSKKQVQEEQERNKKLSELITRVSNLKVAAEFKADQAELQVDVLTTELDALHAARNLLIAKVERLESALKKK